MAVLLELELAGRVELLPGNRVALLTDEALHLRMTDVVVVESPAKAKTINRYLGGGYTVLASLGHVRDLPPKDGSRAPRPGLRDGLGVRCRAAKSRSAPSPRR